MAPRTKTGQFKKIIGIDEAGRGPLAGPVAVGAVCFLTPECVRIFKGVKESKQLSEAKREWWYARLLEEKARGTIVFAVSLQSAQMIDARGLSFVIRKAIATCLKKLNQDPANTRILLDGGLRAPSEYLNQETIIKGDCKEQVIALASIAAKVTRDHLLVRLAKKYPQYGLEVHKGYGTKTHREMIKKYGATFIHRKSFLKNIVQ